jgi:hypothetical protein
MRYKNCREEKEKCIKHSFRSSWNPSVGDIDFMSSPVLIFIFSTNREWFRRISIKPRCWRDPQFHPLQWEWYASRSTSIQHTRRHSLHQLLRNTLNNTGPNTNTLFSLTVLNTRVVNYNLYSWWWAYKWPKNVELKLEWTDSTAAVQADCALTPISSFIHLQWRWTPYGARDPC